MIKCPKCNHKWHSTNDLLEDKDVDFIGVMAFDKKKPEEGLRLYNHLRRGCMTTLALSSEEFETGKKE